MAKYYLWDQLDNIRDLAHQRSPGYAYAYFCGLQNILQHYAAYLGSETLRPVRMYQFLTDPEFRRKYMIEEFPDARFMQLAARCFEDVSLAKIEQLTEYVQSQMGGFKLDGWTLKVPCS